MLHARPCLARGGAGGQLEPPYRLVLPLIANRSCLVLPGVRSLTYLAGGIAGGHLPTWPGAEGWGYPSP